MKIIRAVVLVQSLLYSVTGAWAIIHVSSFMAFTRNFESPFKTEANGVLFFTIGAYLLYSWYAKRIDGPIIIFGCSTALLLAIVDYYYLVNGGTTVPFWADFGAELVIAIILGFHLFRSRKNES